MFEVKEYTKNDMLKVLPRLSDEINKFDRGGVLVCGGSWDYRGAPLLTTKAALRAGAGYVVLAIPDFMVPSAAVFLPEAIIAPIKTVENKMVLSSLQAITARWENRCQTAVFGMGAGRSAEAETAAAWFWSEWSKPLILDADALYYLAKNKAAFPSRENTIITPHSGEASRLLSISSRQIAADRISAVIGLSKLSSVALLKGKNSLVASNSAVRKIVAGAPSLAIPGSGDVLSGVVAAFAASGIDCFDAASAAATAHGLAGERLMEKYGVRGALASEIADEIPYVLG